MLLMELVARCKDVFLRCDQFESDESLSSVFISSELNPFQSKVGNATTVEKRVDMLLRNLTNRRIHNGRLVIQVFVDILITQYPEEDQLNHDLRQLAADIAESTAEKIVIPFVVVALKSDEADRLVSKEIFQDRNVAPARQDDFDAFFSALQEYGIDDLSQYYGESHQSWRPPFCDRHNIEEIITDTIEHINESYVEQRGPKLEAEFVSQSFFSEKREERLFIIDKLQNQGGVVVVDAITVFHPFFSDMMVRSQISALEHVAILVISPIDAMALSINQQIESILGQHHEPAYSRFDADFDRLCDIDLGNVRSLKRWLTHAVPETANFIRDPSIRGKKKGRRRMQKARPEPPMGMGGLIARGGVQ